MEKEFLDSWEIGGKTCLITGANAGIGYQAALRLANLGAHVLLGAFPPPPMNLNLCL